MRLPEVQDRLFKLANQIALMRQAIDLMEAEVRTLARQISRRPSLPHGARTSVPMTPEIKQKIRDYKRQHPDATHAVIGQVFKVNGGRVSEALRGKRT